MPTLKDFLPRVIDGEDLSREDAAAAMDSIMSGGATPAQIGAFLVAMRLKGETTDEIAGCAEVMRKHATKITVTGNVSGVSILGAATLAAGQFMPMQPCHLNADHTAMFFESTNKLAVPIALGNEKIKVVVAAGGDTKTGTLKLIIGG